MVCRITASLLALGCAGALAVSAVASTGAQVSVQKVQAGGTFPVAVPGQHPAVRQGDRLRHGQRLISRRVTLPASTSRHVTLTCPGKTRNNGVAVSETAKVAFESVGGKSYVGRRLIRIVASSLHNTGPSASGTVYALCS
jgi:hypothetical protein